MEATENVARAALVSANNLVVSLQQSGNGQKHRGAGELDNIVRNGESLLHKMQTMNTAWENASAQILQWLDGAEKSKKKLDDSKWLSVLSLNPFVIALAIIQVDQVIDKITQIQGRAKELGINMNKASIHFQTLHGDIAEVVACSRHAIGNSGDTAFGKLPNFLPSVHQVISNLHELIGDIQETRMGLTSS